jgi:endonuclease III
MPARVPRNLVDVADLLRVRYRDFDHYNLRDPLDELLFIICSTRTTERGYLDTYNALRRKFPQNGQLVAAPASEIAEAIRRGGLSLKKAAQIRDIVSTCVARFGEPSLKALQAWPDAECERFLLSLPGVGKKVARCVMLYALDRAVFPVDQHCWRVSLRLGWIRRTRKNRSGSPRDEERLQEKIPPAYRFSLHVNMISLGRDCCKPIRPDCGRCPITSVCRKIGVRALSRPSAALAE